MDLKLDGHYIVKFFGWFNLVNLNKCVLMFEMLDMNLEQYCERFSPLPLSEIRTAIIQVRILKSQSSAHSTFRWH